MWYGLAIVAGCALALQAGANGALASRIGSPVTAALISFSIGMVALAAGVAVLRAPVDRAAFAAPWWAWSGGVLGAIYVAAVAAAAPRIGAGPAIAFVLIGQISLAVLLDHFGLLGFARQALTLHKAIGLAAVTIGVLLIRAA